jgi:pimeloyl-[acyl-carrier protein] methyl ester esterase
MGWYRNRSDEQLWYEEQGNGCPVVLVHGWCMSSAVWKYQFAGLSDALRTLAPDLRGHGRSRGNVSHMSFEGFANDLIDMFDKLELSKVILVGWSMGAQIALHASTGLSDRLAGLVLVSATPRFAASDDFPFGLNRSEADGMRLKVLRNTQRALEGFISRLFAEGELEGHPLASEIKQLLSKIPSPDSAAVLEALETLTRADMRHILASIAIPTLILNGTDDRICLPQASTYLRNNIPGAEQTVMPGCGHAPFLTQSRLFNAEIIRFSRSIFGTND